MSNELSLMEKLAISKKIMDKHNQTGRGQSSNNYSSYGSPSVDNYEPVSANYNIPQEFLK